jgi:hypothetical protein
MSSEFGIKQGFDGYMYSAYVCLLLSYATTNILVLRVLLVLSAIFFILWACLNPILRIQVDTIIFNGLFIVINIYNSIPLMREVLPITMSQFEEEIYERDFKDHLTRRQFKHFISKFQLQNRSAKKSDLCSNGNTFDGVFYFAKINSGASVNILLNNEVLKVLKSGSWMGIKEYFHKEKFKEKPPTWNIHVETTNENGTVGEDTGVLLYHFDLKTMDELNSDPDYEFVFKNAIQAIWMSYATNYVLEQDKEVFKNVKVLNEKKNKKSTKDIHTDRIETENIELLTK